jgi:hypothetical protein
VNPADSRRQAAPIAVNSHMPSEECQVGSQHPQVGHDAAACAASSRRQLLLLPERQLEVAEQQVAVQEGALLQRRPAAAAAPRCSRLLQKPPPVTAGRSQYRESTSAKIRIHSACCSCSLHSPDQHHGVFCTVSKRMVTAVNCYQKVSPVCRGVSSTTRQLQR